MNVVIIKYNAGNTQSVIYALERLGITPALSDDFDTIRSADRVIFPGVGEASTTMEHLKAMKLDGLIPELRQPVLGICLGMQLMCRFTEEGNTRCMGIFDAKVLKFAPIHNIKVPHMGWNDISTIKGNWTSREVLDTNMYFVHSYYVPVIDETAAICDYGQSFSAALQKDNFYATQFHPEKSAKQGQQIIKNFIEL